VLSLIVAYRSFGRFRQASTHLDTPPFSLSHHPFSGIALLTGGKNCSDMALFGELKAPFLRQFLRLRHGIPKQVCLVWPTDAGCDSVV
jgi:hypothetical protein